MKFTVLDRILIERIYPQQSDILTQVLVRDLKEKLKFSQKELTAIEFKVENNNYIYDVDKANKVILDIELTEKELELLKKGVEQLDKEKKVTPVILDLCLKIKNE